MKNLFKQTAENARSHQTRQVDPLPVTSESQPMFDAPLFRGGACCCEGDCPRCQSKNDFLETEAETVAEQVVHNPSPEQPAQQEAIAESKIPRPKPFVQDANRDVSKIVPTTVLDENQEPENEDHQDSEIHLKTFFTGPIPNPNRSDVVTEGPGEPMPPADREFFEPRFRRDFWHVQIHRDETAARYSRTLRAKAFTVGDHIFFAKNQYRPGSPASQRLMAHELTHVIQQTRTGINPHPQRTQDEALEREYELDLATSRVLEYAFGYFSLNDDILAHNAETLVTVFRDSSNQPFTHHTSAQLLLRIHQTGRMANHAAFSRENLAAWQEAVQQQTPDWPRIHAPANPRPSPEVREAAAQEVSQENEAAETAAESPEGPVTVTSDLQEVAPTGGERAARGRVAGGPEIRNGLARLRSTPLQSVNQAVDESIARNFGLDAQSQSRVRPDATLLSVAGTLLYISRLRCYVLDRSGHISGDTFAFDLQWSRDLRPGTYFYSNFGAAGSRFRTLLRIDGSDNVSVVWTSLRTPDALHSSVGESSLDFQVENWLEMSRVLQRSPGIGIIVAVNTSEASNQPTSLFSANLEHIEQAWSNAFTRELLLWALEIKINDVWNNLYSELSQAVIDNILEAILTRIPGGRRYMMMYMGLQLSAWLGEVSSIAGFGTPDEVEIAAQYIARSVVNFVVDEFVLENAVGMVGHGASRSFQWSLRTRTGVVEGEQPVSSRVADAAQEQTDPPSTPAADRDGASPENATTETPPTVPGLSATPGNAPSPRAARQVRPSPRANFEGEETDSDTSGGRSFHYRPPGNPRLDPLDPDRMPTTGPMPVRPVTQTPARPSSPRPEPLPAGPEHGSAAPRANIPSPQRHLPGTLTPEMLRAPSIGMPPGRLSLHPPRVPEGALPKEAPTRYDIPDLAASTIQLYVGVLRAINFENATAIPQSETPSLGRRAPQTASERENDIARRRESLEALRSNSSGLPNFDQRLLSDLFRLAHRRLDLELELNEIIAESADSQMARIMRLARAQQRIEEQIIALIDRPNLGWGNAFRHNRSLTEVMRIAMNYSLQQAIDIVDTDADPVNWRSETPPDQELSTGIAEIQPSQAGHETFEDARQPAVDARGNYWQPIEGTANWAVRLSSAGHRYLTQVLRLRLLHYLQMEPLEGPLNEPLETLGERIGRSYLIVDNQGRLISPDPQVPAHAEDIEFLATVGTGIDPENIDWIYVPSEGLWALHDCTAPEGQVLSYVTESGEMIAPNQ